CGVEGHGSGRWFGSARNVGWRLHRQRRSAWRRGRSDGRKHRDVPEPLRHHRHRAGGRGVFVDGAGVMGTFVGTPEVVDVAVWSMGMVAVSALQLVADVSHTTDNLTLVESHYLAILAERERCDGIARAEMRIRASVRHDFAERACLRISEAIRQG